MNKFLSHSLVLLFLFFALNCGTSSDLGGGTSIGNPPLPTTSLSPEVEENLLVDTITSSDSDTSEISFLINSDLSSEPSFLTGPAGDWSDIVLNGPFRNARVLYKQFENFGQVVRRVLSQAGKTSVESSLVVYSLGETTIAGVTANWDVTVKSINNSWVRINLIHKEQAKIWAHYLVKIQNQVPVKGVFAYVNRKTLSTSAMSQVRFTTISFDFSNEDQNKMTISFEKYSSALERFVFRQIHYQCSLSMVTCTADFFAINSPPPLRTLSEKSFRMTWNDESKMVCAAKFNNTDLDLDSKQQFSGPSQPGESDVSQTDCELETPHWIESGFSVSGLPKRYDDDDSGGLPNTLAGDGESDSSFTTRIQEDVLNDWLRGTPNLD